MTLGGSHAAATGAVLAALAVTPAASAQLPLPLDQTITTPPPTTTVTDPLPLDTTAQTIAELQAQVDELLGTGQLPADSQALTDAVQALNDLIAAAPVGTDLGAITGTLATLTDSVNSLLGPSSSGGTAVKPAPAVAAALATGAASSPAAAGSSLAKPGRMQIVTRKLVVKRGRAKLRVLCPVTSGGCAGSLRTYSKVGRMKSTGGRVKFLRGGQAKTLTLKFGKREERRLRKDKKLRFLILSTFTTRSVKTLKVSVRK